MIREYSQGVLFPEPYLSSTKPLLKWAGGKTQLLRHLRKALPSSFGRYVEPFLGGGALFFDLGLPGSMVSDSNPELVHFYRVVMESPEELLHAVRAMPITREDFYRVRSLRPDSLGPVERAARFVYLNKTCYNGLHRVNRDGRFNTPFGGETNVTILREEILWRASQLLRKCILRCAVYTDILPQLKHDDFVYIDPPYMPVGIYSDFRRYTRSFFSQQDHIRLAKEFSTLARRGVKALLSNSFNEQILTLYRGHWHTWVLASRQINCQASGRGKVREVLIANYPAEGFNVLS